MTSNFLKLTVIFLAILIFICFCFLLYGLYSKISNTEELTRGEITRYSLNLSNTESIKDVKIINENNFEANLKKLEVIVDKLESGDVGLEKSVQLYEEGMKIKKLCDKKLKDIEMQIKKIKIEDNKVVKEDL